MDQLDLAFDGADVAKYEEPVFDFLLGKPPPDWVMITIYELGDKDRPVVYGVLLNTKTADECAIFVAQKIVQKCGEFARGGRMVSDVSVGFF
jgi:hypothetical protein